MHDSGSEASRAIIHHVEQPAARTPLAEATRVEEQAAARWFRGVVSSEHSQATAAAEAVSAEIRNLGSYPAEKRYDS